MLLHLGHASPRISSAIFEAIVNSAPIPQPGYSRLASQNSEEYPGYSCQKKMKLISPAWPVNCPCRHFPGSGKSLPQTGHVFSVGLMCRSALQWEHMTLLSFVFLSAVISHPWSFLWPAAVKSHIFIWPSVQFLRSWPERLSSPLLRSIILQFGRLVLWGIKSSLEMRSNLELKVCLRSLPERLSLPLLLSFWDRFTGEPSPPSVAATTRVKFGLRVSSVVQYFWKLLGINHTNLWECYFKIDSKWLSPYS